MSHRIRIFALSAIAITLLPAVTLAQKPPTPAPPPPSSTPPSRPTTPLPSPSSSDPTQLREDLVMFLRGRVATHDGAPVPNDLLVERVCNNRVRQEVYASLHGDFSMQLGSRNDSYPAASGDSISPYGSTSRDPIQGIPRRELTNCELRASASGFQPRVVSLMGLDTFGGSVDVGLIVVQRGKRRKARSMPRPIKPRKMPEKLTKKASKLRRTAISPRHINTLKTQ